MALGLSTAGFSPALLYELDEHACDTLRDNDVAVDPPLLCGVRQTDIREVDWTEVEEIGIPVRLLAAGVPCQPFSLAGRHLADRDGRNLFPELLVAVRRLRPQAVIVENVRGLLRKSFQAYFDYILRRLESPSLRPKKDELWHDHDERLRRHQRAVGYEPEYAVEWRLLNAADYGVPQNRSRVFIVATRYDLAVPYRFPPRTHSREALVHAQRSGAYWTRHDLPVPEELPDSVSKDDQSDPHAPWVTVRDGIVDLPDPAHEEHEAKMNHWVIPGARTYKGHTGSALDWPSKTIKAGVHGVPGGENTLINGTGDVRYYTLREAARMQSFPDDHLFSGARLHITRQIGNAVPTRLAEAVAKPLYRLLSQKAGE